MELNKLGRYEITQVLGQGAMGIVYKGVDPKIGRTVALKTLKTAGEIPADQLAEFQRRFEQEAQSAGRLTHPNIVTIYDVGEEQGLAYIAMEFIKGKALDEYISEKSPFSIDQIVNIMVQICEGLGYAHKNGVIHRDIKPANIVLTDDHIAKITDFGIAKITSTSATQTGMVVGTPSYMSPEQITGRGVDNRSDIFSIGAVFYELLTYERAFPGDNITTVMYRVVHENPTPLSVANMAVPAQFDQIVMKALAKNPADRYPDAESMGKDIQNYKNTASTQIASTQAFNPADYKGTVVMSSKTAATITTPASTATTPSAASSSAPAQFATKNKPIVLISTITAVVCAVLLYIIFGIFTSSEKASLQITLNILKGTAVLDGTDYQIENGQLAVQNVSAEEHELLIKHEGYDDFKTKLLFAENEEKKLNVTMKLVPVQFPAGVDTAYLTISSKPDIIAVQTNTGKFIGYTPLLKVPFPVGKHTLVYSKEYYVTQTKDVDLRKRREYKDALNLEVKKGTISVSDVIPKKVQVLLDGEPLKSEKDGVTYIVPFGKRKITLKHEGFKPFEQEVVINSQEILKLNSTLEQLFGAISITSIPVEADVFIDGNNVGKTPLKLDKVAAGQREIKVQKGNLLSIKKFTVIENQENNLADLKLLASVGYLKLVVNPWAKIYVDGKSMGSSPPIDNLELKPGTYKIKIENPAYRPVTKNVTINAGSTTSLQHDFK
ncbi:serine/threonine protein kinase [bacterium]|nr:serine/threonine protein kinase [bacterium]